ncbi:response regulator [Candidatus Fermentibacteria bacterium]|nr:response regulator [Candidatus Fermentibacteria bacterium]
MTTERILIVDDREENRYLLRAMLQGNGYDVLEARHGAEALETARQTPPDLVISDILMPVMDGFALCREWLRDERLGKIPFIFYTATYTDSRDREFALGLGASRFIVKPQEPEAFMEIIREALRHVVAGRAALASPGPTVDEAAYLQQYNEALIRKLETKMEQLEHANRMLEHELEERTRMEADLRESEVRYRALFEHMASASCLDEVIYREGIPVDYRLVDVNPAFERVTGISRGRAIGALASELYDSPQVWSLDVFTGVAETGTPARFEAFVPAIGKHLDIVVSCPRKGMFSTVFSDITERKRLEDELRSALDEQAWLLKSMMNAFVVCDSVFDADGRFVSYRFRYINDAYERITGVKRNEVYGKTVHEVWPETEESWIENYGAVAVTGVAMTFEMYHAPTAKHYHCHVYRPWDSTARFCVVFDDITARVEASAAMASRLDELRRWHTATLGRETRILELKREINELLAAAGQPPRYSSAEEDQWPRADSSRRG